MKWLKVGRFAAALSSLSRRSTSQQSNRKLELMMRQPQSLDAGMNRERQAVLRSDMAWVGVVSGK